MNPKDEVIQMFLEELSRMEDLAYLNLCITKIHLLKSAKETMQRANEYYSENGTLKGCSFINYRIIPEIEDGMKKRGETKPFSAARIANLDTQIFRMQTKAKEIGNFGKTTRNPER